MSTQELDIPEDTLAKLSPDHPIFAVMERIGKIEDCLTRNDPQLPTHLKIVHQELLQYEELAHLLKPEQIGILMKGFQQHTSITLVSETAKKSSGKKKIGVDDLI